MRWVQEAHADWAGCDYACMLFPVQGCNTIWYRIALYCALGPNCLMGCLGTGEFALCACVGVPELAALCPGWGNLDKEKNAALSRATRRRGLITVASRCGDARVHFPPSCESSVAVRVFARVCVCGKVLLACLLVGPPLLSPPLIRPWRSSFCGTQPETFDQAVCIPPKARRP